MHYQRKFDLSRTLNIHLPAFFVTTSCGKRNDILFIHFIHFFLWLCLSSSYTSWPISQSAWAYSCVFLLDELWLGMIQCRFILTLNACDLIVWSLGDSSRIWHIRNSIYIIRTTIRSWFLIKMTITYTLEGCFVKMSGLRCRCHCTSRTTKLCLSWRFHCQY